MSKSAVILLSGGLDSATVLAMANAQGYNCHALSFAYGQRHNSELKCAEKVAKTLGVVSHVVTDIDLSTWGGSALTDAI
ncbi:MAG TPA: 7-cyano-7-deazaguanine synthase, partial [Phycisphaerales bacterium]|nr:7-cyano-7-deazaguanine synthase [Phycisphaerales bacterium]